MPIRFHLDENVHRAIALGLQLRGIDATTASDANLIQASDQEHIVYGLREGRVIFTHDDDFLTLHAEGVEHAGITFCHPRHRSIGQIVLRLADLHRSYAADDLRGRVVFL